ncbi:MAG: MATE family efflux transporter [Clostridiales bacterium]|nr:MATE family efflux transporter [Clostridiales bacterium]
MAANLMNTLYTLVDLAVIGNYLDSAALSAASIGGQLTMLLYSMALGLGNGGQILISQYVGAKRREELSATIGTLITIGAGLGLVLTVIGLVFARPLLSLLHPDASVFENTVSYFVVCCTGLIPYYIFNVVSAVFRGLGDSRAPFLISAVTAGMNIILDLLFLVVLHRGVAGAALATVISQFCSCAFALIYLIPRQKKLGIRMSFRNFLPEGEKLRLIVRLALPLCCGNLCVGISMSFVQSLVNPYGVIASAVNGVGSKLNMVVQVVTGALQAATATFVGQNMGARKPERAQKAVLWSALVGVVFGVAFMTICLTMPKMVFGLFSSEADVLELSVTYLQIAVWGYLAMALMGPSQGLMMGVGATKLSLFVSMMDGVVARIGLSVLFGTVIGLGLRGYWMGAVAAPYVSVLLGWSYFLAMRWKKKTLVEAAPGQT